MHSLIQLNKLLKIMLAEQCVHLDSVRGGVLTFQFLGSQGSDQGSFSQTGSQRQWQLCWGPLAAQ